jgi:hypothetical protein
MYHLLEDDLNVVSGGVDAGDPFSDEPYTIDENGNIVFRGCIPPFTQ